MITVGLLVRLEAEPGREEEVAELLLKGLTIAVEEPLTTTWFAFRLGKRTFAVFDAFADEAGRRAHLSGPLAETLLEKSVDLFAQPPVIEEAEIIAAKLPAI